MNMTHFMKNIKILIFKINNLKLTIKNLKNNKEPKIKTKMNKPNLNSS